MSLAATIEIDTQLAGAAECAVSVITDLAGLAELEKPWNRLFAASPAAAPPLRYEWIRNWWRVFGPDFGRGGGLRVVVIRQDSEIIGLLPLYERLAGAPALRVRQLRFISTGLQEFEETCTAYQNLLYAPGKAPECVNQLESTLKHSADLPWDELILSDMPEDSPLLQLRERLAGGGRVVKVKSSGTCHLSNLEGGMDQYLQRLATDKRRKSKKAMRELNDEAFKFEIAETAEQADLYFGQLIELHRARWMADGKRGSFSSRHANFHRSLAIELVPRGQVVLARLCHQGRPIALSYNHRVGAKVDAYQVGIDHETPAVQSAGASLLLATLSCLCQREVVVFDHLVGINRFKQDFAKEHRSLLSLRVMRPRIRFVARAATNVSVRAVRKAIRLISRR